MLHSLWDKLLSTSSRRIHLHPSQPPVILPIRASKEGLVDETCVPRRLSPWLLCSGFGLANFESLDNQPSALSAPLSTSKKLQMSKFTTQSYFENLMLWPLDQEQLHEKLLSKSCSQNRTWLPGDAQIWRTWRFHKGFMRHIDDLGKVEWIVAQQGQARLFHPPFSSLCRCVATSGLSDRAKLICWFHPTDICLCQCKF